MGGFGQVVPDKVRLGTFGMFLYPTRYNVTFATYYYILAVVSVYCRLIVYYNTRYS